MFPTTTKIAMLVLASTALACTETQAREPGCAVLLSFKGSLWLAQANRTAPIRIAKEKRYGRTAALHPSGKMVAYTNPDTEMGVVLADETGRVLSEANVGAEQILTHLSWLSETVLLAGEHRNPNYSQFHLLRVEPDGRLSLIARDREPGIACVVAPGKVAKACPSADELSEAQVELRSILNWDGIVARPARANKPARRALQGIDAVFNGTAGKGAVLERACN
jgi:hypothetical protein